MPWISSVALATVVLIALCCTLAILRQRHSTKLRPNAPVRLAALLGSGGHTSEMLALLSSLPADQYAPFLYMVSSGDTHSSAKACAFEEQYRGTSKAREGLCVAVPRARSVGQSWLTTPFTVAWSLGFCMWAFGLAPLYAHWRRGTRLPFVDVILMNGPATCVPVALVAYAPRLIGLPSPRIVYIESFARVRSLSLTARILRHVVDEFVVQWRTADPSATYCGLLV